MALSFGVTVLPDPPYTRMIELMQFAEAQGFEYAWTYDSHVLWQESMPTLAIAADRTSKIKLGHMVTNPGTREPTVLASAYATLHDISNGRMIMGIGRGDSARRYIGQQPVKVAEFEDALRMIKPFMNGSEVALEREGSPAQVGASGAAGDRDARRRLRPEGACRRRTPGRRRDHPARRPRHHPVDHGHRAQAAEEAGRDPAALKCIVSAPSHVTDDLAGRARAGALVPGDGLEPRAGPDRPLRHRRQHRSEGAHRVRARARSSTTTTSTRASVRSTASSSPTRSATASA